METTNVLLQCTFPRNRHHKQDRIKPKVVKSLAEVPSGRENIGSVRGTAARDSASAFLASAKLRCTPTDWIAFRGYLVNYVGEPIHRDSLDRLQKPPLINMGLKQFIQENSVPLVSREFLQGQGNQISKSTFGHSVLAREKSVIRIEPYFVPFFHGASQQCPPEPSRGAGGSCTAEEHPNMRTISRPRALDGSMNVEASTRSDECRRVGHPRLLIKVHGKEPAGFVQEKWVNADRLFSGQMIFCHLVR
jgi:hypothetical protein